MLPLTTEFASGDEAPGSWDALLSEMPRDGLFVVRRKVEQQAAGAAAALTAPSGAGEEGPVVGVVSLRYNTNADGSDSIAESSANSSGPIVHTMDCLVYGTVLATL
jgi:hypothetical protein